MATPKGPQISYLSYPKFERDPHPALAGALIVPLRSFHVRHYDYTMSSSPPILHRKEKFVHPDHPLRAKFEELTRQEERWGLYEQTSVIGAKEGWDQVLDR